MPAGGQTNLAGEQRAGEDILVDHSIGHWEEDVQDDAHDEVNQEIPHVPTAPPISTETELLLQHMVTVMSGPF